MAACTVCLLNVNVKNKYEEYVKCVKCENLTHVDCCGIAHQFISKHKVSFHCKNCKPDLTSKSTSHVSRVLDDLNKSGSTIRGIDVSENTSSLSKICDCDNLKKELSDSENHIRDLSNQLAAVSAHPVPSKPPDENAALEARLIKLEGLIMDLSNKVTSVLKAASPISTIKPISPVPASTPLADAVVGPKEMPKPNEKPKVNFDRNNICMCKGNILQVPREYAIAHCVGLDLLLSDGVAKDIKEYFHLDDEIEDLKHQNHSVGDIVVIQKMDKTILNLITKEKSKIQPSWKQMNETIKGLPAKCTELNITKLCMPKLGSGLDEIPWKTTMKLLKNVFANTDIEVHVLTQTREEEEEFKARVKNRRFKKSPSKRNKLLLLGDSHFRVSERDNF